VSYIEIRVHLQLCHLSGDVHKCLRIHFEEEIHRNSKEVSESERMLATSAVRMRRVEYKLLPLELGQIAVIHPFAISILKYIRIVD